MGEKDINCHMTLHYICTQGSTEVTYYCQKNAQGTLHISQNCLCWSRRTELTLVSLWQNLVFSVCFRQWDYPSIDGQKTELPKDANGSEMHAADGREPLYATEVKRHR